MAQESGPREWTVEEVADVLTIPGPSLADTLEALVAAGQIRRVGSRYRLHATAEDSANSREHSRQPLCVCVEPGVRERQHLDLAVLKELAGQADDSPIEIWSPLEQIVDDLTWNPDRLLNLDLFREDDDDDRVVTVIRPNRREIASLATFVAE
jgi:hypothetical protein